MGGRKKLEPQEGGELADGNQQSAQRQRYNEEKGAGGGPHKAGMGEVSLHPIGFKRALMLELCILGRFPPFHQGKNESFCNLL
jgi:hypothetical protein